VYRPLRLAISTRNLDELPDPPRLRRVCVSIAILDAILSPDWQYRYYSFFPRWGPGAQMALMRNGSGDDWRIGFSGAGVVIKGFDHESEMSPFRRRPPRLWPGLYEGVPPALRGFHEDPSFEPDRATYCIWWDALSPGWRTGVRTFAGARPDPDGSSEQLAILDGAPATYISWATSAYERDLALPPIVSVYAHEPITRALVAALNHEADADEVLALASEAGYGHA
jgi:hypothetical protein